MQEIIDYDYNLNISRYVSTAEAEKEIDLAKVHADLVDIEAELITRCGRSGELARLRHTTSRLARESGHPANLAVHAPHWIPAFAGMTNQYDAACPRDTRITLRTADAMQPSIRACPAAPHHNSSCPRKRASSEPC